ncbi:hypothetical protein KP509_35G056200 [Ceratopteris richardii]|uniref:Uncharacterized protein n=1 Tax=Ceratopteris richardii TaxID=49495 RepID=A0A8T2QGZ9_CERRI|nr:hypothetical protein KP509_35G056200 [Ceratopteris richardii]
MRFRVRNYSEEASVTLLRKPAEVHLLSTAVVSPALQSQQRSSHFLVEVIVTTLRFLTPYKYIFFFYLNFFPPTSRMHVLHAMQWVHLRTSTIFYQSSSSLISRADDRTFVPFHAMVVSKKET